MSAATRTENRPRTRQRAFKPPPVLSVPHIDENAAERKRVLNVLAQRRYREKKRLSRRKNNSGYPGHVRKDGTPNDDNPSSHTPEASPDCQIDRANATNSSQDSSPGSLPAIDINLNSWNTLNDEAIASLVPETGLLPDFFSGLNNVEETSNVPAGTYSESSPWSTITLDPSCLTATTSSSSPSAITFPDSYHLPVHELTLLRAMLRIADRIGCKDQQLWSPECLSPFNIGDGTPAEQLPLAWRPTTSQITVPHHPLIDMMPWPGVRDRILLIFSLPEEAKPPPAAGPLALVNLVYDIEDNAEGIRIYGEDPCDAESWEVGQVFFQRWWFLFDRDIIDTSNRWRRLRGAPPLMLTNG